MPLIIPSNSISGGYEVANSLRFDDGSSDHLTRSLGASETSTTKGTFSFWVKRGQLTTAQMIYTNEVADDNNRGQILFEDDDTFMIRDTVSGSNTTLYATSQLFRDTSAWLHLVVALDSTQAGGNRIRVYKNGTRIPDAQFGTSTEPNQNSNFNILTGGQTNKNHIGKVHGGSNYFDGYLAEFVYCDGQVLDATSFGEFDEDSGIWKPIDVSGLTFGTNGFYLDFENSGSLGADVSGNGNNFTVNNLTSIDQTTDTCTNNFCTFNPLSADEMTFSQGNLKVVTASSPRSDDNARGTMGVNSGKWYWEIKTSGAVTPAVIGICFDELKMGSDLSGLTGVYAIQNASGTFAYKRENGTTAQTSGFPNPVNNDIVNVALDCDNSKLYIGINGTYYNQAGSTGNPATGSNETFSGIDMSYFWLPWLEARSTDAQGEANFGSPPFTISSGNSDANDYGNFEYSVPSGYYTLNTKNLSEYG